MAERIENPYRAKSLCHELYDGDFRNLLIEEIAERFKTTKGSVRSTINRIKRETGYFVPHKIGQFYKNGTSWMLLNDDWSDLTVREIADVLDKSVGSVYSAISILEKSGYRIAYKRKKKVRS